MKRLAFGFVLASVGAVVLVVTAVIDLVNQLDASDREVWG